MVTRNYAGGWDPGTCKRENYSLIRKKTQMTTNNFSLDTIVGILSDSACALSTIPRRLIQWWEVFSNAHMEEIKTSITSNKICKLSGGSQI